MTSLSRQLARLKDAPSSGQGVERDYSSLLFNKKEAASLDREQAYKLGLVGLAQLKKIDPTIDEWEPELFAETSLDFNRSMITKEENEKITASLERMITLLAPYFHHQACKQVLEWLIYRYQIHSFDAEFVAIAFLPFHDMNSYGRLGSILTIKKNDWQWMKEMTKEGAPIPFNFITRQCLIAGGNMHLIGAVGNFLTNLTKTFDDEFVTKNYQYFFLFFTKLIASLFEDPANATDQLISRIMPQLGIALKSKVLPYKISGMILIAQLAMTVTFTQETLFPIISLLLNKVKSSIFSTAMDTFIVICQRQSLDNLPIKTIRKLVKRREELDLDNYFQKIQSEADLAGFLKPFWATLLNIYNHGVEDEDFSDLMAVFDVTTEANQLSSRQASDLMNLVVQNLVENENIKIPKTLQRNLKAVILRFGPEFDVIRSKYKKKNESELCLLIEQCQIQPHEIGDLDLERKRKRRRRTSSTKSAEDAKDENENKTKKLDRHTLISKIVEPEQRKPFNDSPLQIIFKFSQNKWDEIAFMLQSFKRPEYLKKFINDDFESFAVKVITFVATSKVKVKEEIKVALSHITLNPDFVFKLLSKAKTEPQPKKSKPVGVKATEPLFLNESDEQYQKRLLFVLEILNINTHYKADGRLFVFLFDLIEEVIESKKDSDTDNYKLSLTISLFLKHVQQPDAATLLSNSLRLDAIVKVIRFTNDHNVLRNALHILALLAPHIPGRVVTQIMSVFTFMGDGGVLKKDNDLTLSVVEEALNALFTAIMNSEKTDTKTAKFKIRQKLLEVSKIFAVSLIDIPAHRRMRILRAVGNTVSPDDLWIFLGSIYDNFCTKWQKSTSKKNDVDVIHEITLEFIGEFEPEVQLITAINLLDYVIKLGADHQSAADRLKTSNTNSNELIVFDRDSRSVQKLRYFRFLIFGWVLKFFNYKPLYEQLGALDDEKLYERMLEVGKKLLITVTNVADFMENGLKVAEDEQEKFLQTKDATENDKNAAVQKLRYWVALAAKADIICDRMRCLLPANVSGHIICDLLIDADDKQKGIEPHIRDRAMQLLNVKMIAQSGFDQSNDKGDIHTEYLMKFAKKLNEWITPAEKRDEINLCQNAAFSLKLVAKKIPPQDGLKVFTETMEKCVALLRDWASFDEAMIGNILLLVGELVRSQNLKSTVLYSEAICSNTIEILRDCEKKASDVIEQIEIEKQKVASEGEATAANSRRKRSQLSLCGKHYGDDVLLLCALTCSQRLFDHSSKFITSFYEPFIHVVSQLGAKYMTDSDTSNSDEVNKAAVSSPRMDNIRLRLTFIRTAISKQEIRLLVEPFTNVSSKLMKRPLTLASLTGLIADSIKHTKTDYITKVIEQLVEMFMILFKFRKSDKKVEKFEFYNQCEDSILVAFLALIDHLKADGLRPIVNSLVEHVKASISDPSNTRLMAITVFNFANQFYDSYHNLAIPYFSQLFDLSIKILKNLNAAKTDSDQLFINGIENDTIEAAQANHLIILILKFINKCARHSTFFTDDLVKASYPAVLDEIENIKVSGHEDRCIPHLSNCIYSIAEASVDIFNREICNSLLLRSRHSSAKIRHRSILIFEQLVDRIGDSLAPLLPMIVQYLSELLEDTNKKVTTQAEKTIRLLRLKFGDDVFGKE
uniref:HEAT repeat-containing protein 1 n=1 Tax=Panagrolaimus superbus TaxID=310955 RepID=A0A914Y6U5_9BILA